MVQASKTGWNFHYQIAADKMQEDQKERVNRDAGLEAKRLWMKIKATKFLANCLWEACNKQFKISSTVSETKERESIRGGSSPADENKRKNVALNPLHENKELCQRGKRSERWPIVNVSPLQIAEGV